ncbi:hypothetical protein L7F22_011888 [Adiantum nelumboides]|nr:hypothetical protein [Adiantum nelumboides]
MAFPNIHGRRGENTSNFLDDLEMAFLVFGRDDEEIKLGAFPLVLGEEAKVWFQDLDVGKQGLGIFELWQPCSQQPPASRPLKARLASDEPLYGAFLCSFSPTLAKILGQVGYNYVVLDMVHGLGDTFAALPCMQALAAAGVPAIVRIAANNPVLIKKAMDLGPQGVMVPMIETTTDAGKVVASCQYPPRGNHGAAHPIVRASMYGLDISYLKMCANDKVLKTLQIESSKAVGRIPNISAVDGVDCLILGPTNLSSCIRYLHDPGHDNVMKLMHRVEKAIL